MQVDLGMRAQEFLDPRRVMGGEIVRDDVQLRARRLVGHHLGEEGDEFLAGRPSDGFAEGGVERQRAWR